MPDNPLLTSNEFLIGAGGKGDEIVKDMYIDGNENIYLTGMARYNRADDSLRFGNRVVRSFGGEDAFVVKYDPKGNVTWVRLMGSTRWESGDVIGADSDGNCFVAGVFGGQTNFGNSTLVPVAISNASGIPNPSDMFLAKYDPDGKEIWVKQISGPGSEYPTSLLVDKAGNLLVTGYFYQHLNLGTTSVKTPGTSFFLAKYASNGTLLWVKHYGDNSNGSIYSSKLKLDNDNKLIIGGSFMGQQAMGPFNMQPVGNQDVFVAKLDDNGEVQWVKTFGGGNDEICNAVAIDRANGVYVGGIFKESIAAGGMSISATGISSDAFFAKLTPGGDIEWVKSASGSGEEGVQDMFIQNDTLYSLGYFSQDFAIENHASNAGNSSSFITKHDLKGSLSAISAMNLNSGFPKNIYVNRNGYGTITGSFTHSILFENMGISSTGSSDLFLLRKKLVFK